MRPGPWTGGQARSGLGQNPGATYARLAREWPLGAQVRAQVAAARLAGLHLGGQGASLTAQLWQLTLQGAPLIWPNDTLHYTEVARWRWLTEAASALRIAAEFGRVRGGCPRCGSSQVEARMNAAELGENVSQPWDNPDETPLDARFSAEWLSVTGTHGPLLHKRIIGPSSAATLSGAVALAHPELLSQLWTSPSGDFPELWTELRCLMCAYEGFVAGFVQAAQACGPDAAPTARNQAQP